MEESGDDGVTPDVSRSVLLGDRPRHRQERGLRRRVGPLPHQPVRRSRGHVHDAAAALGQELLDRPSHDQERAADVDGEHLVPLVEGGADHQLVPQDAGVVHHHVDPVHPGDGIVEQALNVGLAGNVGGDDVGAFNRAGRATAADDPRSLAPAPGPARVRAPASLRSRATAGRHTSRRAPDGDAGVDPTEAERVRERRSDPVGARHVRHEVKISSGSGYSWLIVGCTTPCSICSTVATS